MKLYMVNEKPDGSGRWWWAGSPCDEQGDYTYATLFEHRRDAAQCEKFGGHVVEFTVGERPTLQLVQQAACDAHRQLCSLLKCPLPGALTPGEVAQHIRDHFAAKPEPRKPDHWLARRPDGKWQTYANLVRSEFDRPELAAKYGTPVSVYIGEPPPAPAEREPDAVMVCDPEDGSPDWGDMLPCPLSAEHRGRIEYCGHTTRKVYLDTPPPGGDDSLLDDLLDALGWDGGNFHADAIAEVKRLKEDRGDALEEVSRLSKALDETMRGQRLAQETLVCERRELVAAEMRAATANRKADELRAEVKRLEGELDPCSESHVEKRYNLSKAQRENERLQTALDTAKRERDMQSRIANGFANELDELSKQKPVAWRCVGIDGWVYTDDREEVQHWDAEGCLVQPLYAAPKPEATSEAEPVAYIFHGDDGTSNLCLDWEDEVDCHCGAGRAGWVETLRGEPGEQWRRVGPPVEDVPKPAEEREPMAAPREGDIALSVRIRQIPSGEWSATVECDGTGGNQFGDTPENALLASVPAFVRTFNALGHRLVDRALRATASKPDGWLGSWCPQCGPDVGVDEDGLCNSCGDTAVGDGADHAIRLLRREAAPADTPAMVEARRLIAEGWRNGRPDGDVFQLYYPNTAVGSYKWVAPSVFYAMRALRGGK